MKFKRDKLLLQKSIYAFLTAAAIFVFAMLFLAPSKLFAWLGILIDILLPFIWAFVLAYIGSRPMSFFERFYSRIFQKKPRPKLNQALALVSVLLIFFILLYFLFISLIPQIVTSITSLGGSLSDNFDSLMGRIITWGSEKGLNIYSWIGPLSTWKGVVSKLGEVLTNIAPDIASFGVDFISSIASSVSTFVIAFFASIYLLYSKRAFINQTKKITYAFLPQAKARSLISIMRETNDIFSGYISGKILDSAVIGILHYIALLIFGIEYPELISVVIGIFNLVPMFGPIIGAIICGILLLIISPSNALIFCIITIVLQQLDAQVICPRIVGEGVGLKAFWIIFAITVGGRILGVLGALIGIPILAIIFSLLRAYTNDRLTKKGLSTDSSDYDSDDTK